MMQIINKIKVKLGARLLLPALLVVLLILILATTGVAQAFRPGDVDGNDKIDVRDVVLVQKFVLGKITLTEQQKSAALVKGYGAINAQDVTLIMQRAIGRITTFPLNITKVDDVAKTVTFGTTQANIGLPTTVSATLSDGTKRTVSVQWDATSTPAYNPNVANNYVFMGNLVSIPAGITNPGSIRAKAIITVSSSIPVPGPTPPSTVGDFGTVSAASFVYTDTTTTWSFQITQALLAAGQTVTIDLSGAKAGNLAYSTNAAHYTVAGFSVNATNANTAGNERVILTANNNIPVNTTVSVAVTNMTPAGTAAINAVRMVNFTRNDTSRTKGAAFSIAGLTGVSLSPTVETQKGVAFVKGAFTSGNITPAATVYYRDELKVAGLTVYVNWVSGTAPHASSFVYNVNSPTNTATVSVYLSGQTSGSAVYNSAIAMADAIRRLDTEVNVLKATVNAVSAPAYQINISEISETVLPATANSWKFYKTTSGSAFAMVYNNQTITQQVALGVIGSKLHGSTLKEIGTATVLTGASASGSITVNVSDGVLLNQDVIVTVAQGDTAAQVADKIRIALSANPFVTHATNGYAITGTVANIVLTQNKAPGMDVNLQVTLK